MVPKTTLVTFLVLSFIVGFATTKITIFQRGKAAYYEQTSTKIGLIKPCGNGEWPDCHVCDLIVDDIEEDRIVCRTFCTGDFFCDIRFDVDEPASCYSGTGCNQSP